MVDLLRPAFLAVELIALAALLWYGYWRRFPAFCCYFTMAVFVAFTHINIDLWRGVNWIPWQTALTAGRILCALEAAYRLAPSLPRDSRAKGTAITAGLVFFVELMAWGIRSAAPVQMAVLRILNVEFGIVVFLLSALMLFWGISVQIDRWARRHATILLALAANQLMGLWMHPVTRAQWDAILALGYFVGICCCVSLAMNAFSAPKTVPDPPVLTPLVEHP